MIAMVQQLFRWEICWWIDIDSIKAAIPAMFGIDTQPDWKQATRGSGVPGALFSRCSIVIRPLAIRRISEIRILFHAQRRRRRRRQGISSDYLECGYYYSRRSFLAPTPLDSHTRSSSAGLTLEHPDGGFLLDFTAS
jgi:hypothetical protein